MMRSALGPTPWSAASFVALAPASWSIEVNPAATRARVAGAPMPLGRSCDSVIAPQLGVATREVPFITVVPVGWPSAELVGIDVDGDTGQLSTASSAAGRC